MEGNIFTGTITYYSTEKHFGFIKYDSSEEAYFYYNTSLLKSLPKKERKALKKSFVRGDEVEFRIKSAEKGKEAFDVKFIRNQRATQLIKRLNENEVLPGYLKKIGETFYVKDIETYFFLPVSTSNWEIDIDAVYEERINQLVYYLTPERCDQIEKVKVAIADRRFCKTYNRVKAYKDEGITVSAIVTGKNKEGFFITLLDGAVKSFIPFMKNESMPELKKWQAVDVIVTSIYDNGLRVQLT